ncbi:MAG: Gfo/Idh/MocA family protein [Acidobacteriota bacterium]
MDFKVNIIGLGIMGKNAARVLKRIPGVRLTGGADLQDENLEAAKAEFQLENTYQDFHTMLQREKPDAVFIATPDWFHFEPIIACLEAGAHVYVEKPLTTSEKEAAAVVRKVRETGLKLQVSYNHRWLAPYYATHRMIRENKIGECLVGFARKNNPISVPTKMLAGWARQSSPGWFMSSHDIDLIAWWFEDDPVEVKSNGIKSVLKKRGWDTYDALQSLVRFSRGATAAFEACWVYPEKHPALPDSFMEVIGEHGHIHLDRKAEAIEMSTPEGLAWPRTFLHSQIFGKWVGAFPQCIESFFEAIVEDREPYVTAYDGWRSTAVLDAMHQSADSGETVKIPAPPKE